MLGFRVWGSLGGIGRAGLLASGVIACCSCGHVVTKRSSYAEERGVVVNGALVRSAVKPVGGEAGFTLSAMVYTAGSGTLDGPFLWRIEAEGDDGYHKELTVHRVKVETRATQRSQWYPQKLLGKTVEFYPVKGEPGEVFAQYQIPGKLEVFPYEDGEITILVDLTVRSVERSQREVVRFRMAPQRTKDFEFLFLPADIVKGRGKDPKEWEW
ncbi:MAG: hypothetical protein VCA35_10470 [Roseibacillus sp.]